MVRWKVQVLAVGGALLIGFGAAAQGASAPKPRSDIPRGDAYLGAGRLPDPIMILPPPPVAGSPTDQRDRAVYGQTRALAGSPRWEMAARDSVQYIQAYDCALGLRLESGPPEVLRLLGRVGRDASSLTNLAKDHYRVPRPFVGNTEPVCVEKDRSGLTGSPSYPSGHATFSWAVGLILAEMVPEKATEILARARAFGESRVVCGVHTVSDIEEGRTNGSALVAVLHSDPAFQADLAAAKAALRAAMRAPHPPVEGAQCKVEADAELHTPWVNPTSGK